MPNLVGQTTDPGVAGVLGESSTFNGVLGVTTADGHAGVAGVCDTSNGNGVFGRSMQANGVIGFSSSDSAAGVAGANDDGKGNGVYGRSKKAHGVIGESTEWVGVCGVSKSTSGGSGVRGEHATGAGVHGVSSSGIAVFGASPAGVGVRGEGRVAGQFVGNVEISGVLMMAGSNVNLLLQQLVGQIAQLQREVAGLSAKVAAQSRTGGSTTARPSYQYTCQQNASNVVVKVRGSNFPAGKGISISPGFFGTFTAFGVSRGCWEIYPNPQVFRGFVVKSDGTFEAEVTVPATCVRGCELQVSVECDGLPSCDIDRPSAGSGCACS